VLDRCVDNFFAETEQVAFCTQNIVPGIDFSNDPLLQGRNFSYLDTQIKRLGSPNFTFLPINAPKCPFSTFQQDGHMAVANRKGRVNYEPNSYKGEEGGPQEVPAHGFQSFPSQEVGEKSRVRSETFGDHYSQARQFYLSQTEIEKRHIEAAFTFELSKVENSAIRERMVAHLLRVDKNLAQRVASGIRLEPMPDPAPTLIEANPALHPSPALSILANAPKTFEGRKVGVLVSEGAPSSIINELAEALKTGKATMEIIAPTIGGVVSDTGEMLVAHGQLAGSPSVLFDAVILLIADDQIDVLAKIPAIRDFIADAFAHGKYLGYTSGADGLLERVLGGGQRDGGVLEIRSSSDIGPFCQAIKNLRYWEREAAILL
jgi:catalase